VAGTTLVPGTLDLDVLDALRDLEDATAELSDRLDAEKYRLTIPSSSLPPAIPGVRLVGRALTLRYVPERQAVAALREREPDGRLGNRALAALARPGDVIVVQSPDRTCSVLGSEAASVLHGAGVRGAIIDGAIRDVEGLARIGFPSWAAAVTPITGRWRLQALEAGEPVAICGVQVLTGDIVVADAGGVCFLPADRASDLVAGLVGQRPRDQ
jgi:regulator of RNase E activity RraA